MGRGGHCHQVVGQKVVGRWWAGEGTIIKWQWVVSSSGGQVRAALSSGGSQGGGQVRAPSLSGGGQLRAALSSGGGHKGGQLRAASLSGGGQLRVVLWSGGGHKGWAVEGCIIEWWWEK